MVEKEDKKSDKNADRKTDLDTTKISSDNSNKSGTVDKKSKLYECDICGLKFRTKRGLRLHRGKTHGIVSDIKYARKLQKQGVNVQVDTEPVKEEKEFVDTDIKPELEKKQKKNSNSEARTKITQGFLTSGDVEEVKVPTEIEQEKKKFLEQLEERDIGSGTEAGAEAEQVEDILTDLDFGDLYVSVIGIIGNFLYKVDIYQDKDFIRRLKRRGKLLHRVLGKYVEDNDTLLVIVLGSQLVDDIFYLGKLKKEKKEKKEEKEGEDIGGNSDSK